MIGPSDMQNAFIELGNGGSGRQAENDITWHEKFTSLEAYHRVSEDEKKEDLEDLRAAELVSHLMEIAYAWRDDAKFRSTFPLGAALLDRVIIRGS